PDHEVVFAPSSLFLAQHLLPLISIDLSAINPAWQGKIHLLNPIEPYECYIGSDTTEFSDAFANENWFIMQLNQQNQYEWLELHFLVDQFGASYEYHLALLIQVHVL
ncbi:MAG: hypothetical protein RR766_03050, partial [Longicatena sp.]